MEEFTREIKLKELWALRIHLKMQKELYEDLLYKVEKKLELMTDEAFADVVGDK